MKNEFNLLDQNSIIISYEKNIKQKRILIQQQREKLSSREKEIQIINCEIEDLLGQILSTENDYNSLENLVREKKRALLDLQSTMELTR